MNVAPELKWVWQPCANTLVKLAISDLWTKKWHTKTIMADIDYWKSTCHNGKSVEMVTYNRGSPWHYSHKAGVNVSFTEPSFSDYISQLKSCFVCIIFGAFGWIL